MTINNSFTENTSKLLYAPFDLCGKALTVAYYHHCGKEVVYFGSAGSALLLVQAITSVAAIPIQILAGMFSCTYQFLKGEFKEGIDEFANGFITSGRHALAVPVTSLASIGIALYIIVTLPHLIYTWDTYSEWWSPYGYEHKKI